MNSLMSQVKKSSLRVECTHARARAHTHTQTDRQTHTQSMSKCDVVEPSTSILQLIYLFTVPPGAVDPQSRPGTSAPTPGSARAAFLRTCRGEVLLPGRRRMMMVMMMMMMMMMVMVMVMVW